MNAKDLTFEVTGVRPYGAGKAVDVVWRSKEGAVLTYRVGPALDPETGEHRVNPPLIEETELHDQFDVDWDASDAEILALIEAKRGQVADDLTEHGVGVDRGPVATTLVGRSG